MRAGAIAAIVALGVLLTGCSATDGTAANDQAAVTGEFEVGGAPEGGADAAMEAPMPGEEGARALEDGSAVTTSTAADRQIIRSGYMSMRVEDVGRSASEVRGLAAAANGLISSEDVSTSGDNAYATIQAQVPADRLDGFIKDVSALGTVDTVNLSASDVTAQVVDLDARIDALKTSISRLTQLLAQASRIEDLLAIETQLAQRQSELDALTAQRTYLADQVALSTLTVNLAPLTEEPQVEAPGFVSGLKSGWNAFVSVVMVAVTAVGFLLPWLVLLAILAIPVVLIVIRATRRHRRPEAIAAGTTAPADQD
jgi:hypothetical protein